VEFILSEANGSLTASFGNSYHQLTSGLRFYQIRASFYIYSMAKAKKKTALKKRADHYEPKVKTDLSFDELIAMSVNQQLQERKTDKKK
jgi:hypothetical protein